VLEEVSDSTAVTVPAKMYPNWLVRRRKVFSAKGGGLGSAADQEIPVNKISINGAQNFREQGMASL
jgi:hypothetical protein